MGKIEQAGKEYLLGEEAKLSAIKYLQEMISRIESGNFSIIEFSYSMVDPEKNKKKFCAIYEDRYE